MLRAGRPKRYFAFHYVMLRLLGLGWWHHPDEEDTDNFPGGYLPYAVVTQLVWVVGFVGLETIDPFMGSKDVDRFMFSLSFVITHDLTLIKLYIFFFKHKELQEIAKIIEVDMHEHYQNDEMNRKTVRTTRLLTAAYLVVGWATIANSNINGAIQDFKWRKLVLESSGNSTLPLRTLAQPIYIPWDYQGDVSYISTFILEAVGLLWTGHIVMIIDTYIGSLILHMSNQFKILQESFATMFDRAIEELVHLKPGVTKEMINDQDDYETLVVRGLFSESEVECVLEKYLKKCIKQHQALISTADKFARTYSPGFLSQLLSSMAAICVIMVQVSKDASSLLSISFATSLAFFLTMILQLAIQCFTGDELTHQSGLVSACALQHSWRLPPRLRRAVLPVAARAQRPSRLGAGGFASMDHRCFLSIVKAAYSYYAVLSKTTQK